MSHSLLRRGLQTQGNPADRSFITWKAAYHRTVVTLTDPDLIASIAFCVLGLLVALNVILRFPDLGALIEQYNRF
jgi:hypothetical protein